MSSKVEREKFLEEDKLLRRSLTKPRIPRSAARRMWGKREPLHNATSKKLNKNSASSARAPPTRR